MSCVYSLELSLIKIGPLTGLVDLKTAVECDQFIQLHAKQVEREGLLSFVKVSSSLEFDGDFETHGKVTSFGGF